MIKKVKLLAGIAVIAAMLFYSVVGFATTHGLFEGYPVVRIVVDGKEVKGDVPGINFKGRTMVPVRFVSEALGANVEWNVSEYTAYITSPGKEPVVTVKEGVHIESYTDYWDSGWTDVVGEVINYSNKQARFVKVNIRGYDDKGNILATDHAYAEPHHMDPGTTASFKIMIPDDMLHRFSNYKLFLSWD